MASTLAFEFVFGNNASPVVILANDVLTGAAAPTVNISKKAFADGTITSVVSGGALVYDSYTKTFGYLLADATPTTHRYIGMATTTYATASPASVHALGIVIPDELISTRNATTPPTVEAIADGVLDEAKAGHTGHIASIATAAEDNTAHGAGAWGAAAGSGAGSYTDTVTDGTNPLDGVRVQLSTDAAGLHRTYETYSNASGVFALHPDPGVYYVWIDLAGYAGTQGAQVTVT